MTDIWIPRLYVVGQVAVVCVCGTLLAIGRDSAITDLFLAASGALVGTAAYTRMTQGKTKDPSD